MFFQNSYVSRFIQKTELNEYPVLLYLPTNNHLVLIGYMAVVVDCKVVALQLVFVPLVDRMTLCEEEFCAMRVCG